MLKFIIILALTIYVISKIGSFFFRAGISSQQTRYQQRQPGSRVEPEPAPKKRKGTIKGGEYVDYEEIK